MIKRLLAFLKKVGCLHKSYIIAFICLIFLSSCDDCSNHGYTCPRCISADDFGTPTTSILAGFKDGDINFKSLNGEDGGGKVPNQVVQWKSTGYYTTGEKLYVRASGNWLGVLSFGSDKNASSCGKLQASGISKKCQYVDTEYNDEISGCKILGKKLSKEDEDGQCLIEDGYGLYLLFRKKGDPDPNQNLNIMRNPISPVVHIAHEHEGFYSSENRLPKDQHCRDIQIDEGWEIYAKIYDIFYWDNAGGYTLEFINGVAETRGGGVFESIRREVTDFLKVQMENIYKRITQDNNYINFVKALLVLFIIITGLTFLLGMTQMTGSELIIKVIKIAVIIQLISPSSWDFFYNNLFKLFTDGVAEIIAVLNSHSGVEYQSDKPFSSLDKMVSKIFKIWGSTKTRAFLASVPFGIVWVLLMLIVMLIYIVLVAYALIVYLTAFIAISLLIILMPILFLGLLFGPLKYTFENWFTQAISFSMQSIMMFTLVSLFSAMIMNNFYKTLGMKTCCSNVLIFDFSPFGESKIYNWAFGETYEAMRAGFHYDLNNFTKRRCLFEDEAKIIKIPPDYKEEGCRFVEYPFLDPQIDKADCKKGAQGTGRDWEQIVAMRSGDMYLVNWGEIFGIVLLSVMMFHMRDFVQSVGASISGASPWQSVVGSVYTGGDIYQNAKGLVNQLTGIIRNKIGDKIEKTPTAIGRKMILYTEKAGIGVISVTEKAFSTEAAKKVFGDEGARVLGTGAAKVLGGAGKLLGGAGSLLGGATTVFRFAAGMESRTEQTFFYKEQFKEINYVQSVIGYHLGKLSMSGDFLDSAGARFLKWGAKDSFSQALTMSKIKQKNEDGFLFGIKRGAKEWDRKDDKEREEAGSKMKYIMQQGLSDTFSGTKKTYLCDLEKIHDKILGVKQPKPKIDDGKNNKRKTLPDDLFKKEESLNIFNEQKSLTNQVDVNKPNTARKELSDTKMQEGSNISNRDKNDENL